MPTLTEPPPTGAARAERARALYAAHGRALRAFLSGRLADGAAVEDLLQEVFLIALTRELPEEPAAAGRWLLGVARNKLLHHLRDRRPPQPTAERAAPQAGPAERLDAADERARVRAAVAALEPELREVIALRYEGGLSYREVAARLDLPWTTVQGRLKRARLALHAALRPKEGA